MLTLNIPILELQLFFLIFLRVSSILMSVPFFGNRNVPLLFKAGLALTLAYILSQNLKLDPTPLFASLPLFVIGVASEIILGVAIGLIVRLVFNGVQLAGQLAGYQMGMALANVMDPVSSAQVPLVAQIYNLVAMLLFLIFNAHHWLIKAVIDSFRRIPLMGMQWDATLTELLIRLVGQLFVVAVQISAPIMVALLMTSVAFGLMARTVPQMNVFIVAMPLKIVVGLLFISISLTYFSSFLATLFTDTGQNLFMFIRLMGQ